MVNLHKPVILITIKEKVLITKEQHVISIDVGSIVPEGEYEVEMILNARAEGQKGILNFPVSDIDIPLELTFSREEIYGDYGR